MCRNIILFSISRKYRSSSFFRSLCFLSSLKLYLMRYWYVLLKMKEKKKKKKKKKKIKGYIYWYVRWCVEIWSMSVFSPGRSGPGSVPKKVGPVRSSPGLWLWPPSRHCPGELLRAGPSFIVYKEEKHINIVKNM